MNMFPLNGILLLDKDPSWTSHDCVGKLRSITKQKRIGHAGTLDPLATGLLVVLLGSATRLSDYLISDDKEYEVQIRLGQATDTDDSEGSIISETATESCLYTQGFAGEVLSSFVGDSLQIPPLYSSLKKNGKIAHREARKGKSLDILPRPISIYDIKKVVVDHNLNTWSFTVACSKGTYIRALARDIGDRLGVGAHVVSLRRTKSGIFSIRDAEKIQNFEYLSLSELSHHLYPIEKVFDEHLVLSDEFSTSGKFLSISKYSKYEEFKSHFLDTSALNDCLNPQPEYRAKVDSESHEQKMRHMQQYNAYSSDKRLLGFFKTCSEDTEKVVPKVIFPNGIQGPNFDDCVAALGVFDGVHLGHQALLSRLKEKATELNLPSLVITFDPVPEKVTNNAASLSLLTSLNERIALIKSFGIDDVLVIPFTASLANLSAEDFVDRALFTRCNPRHLIVGENFRFGRDAKSDSYNLKQLVESYGTCLEVCELTADQQTYFSSTRVRYALSEGDVKTAARILGRLPSLCGLVVEGEHLGRTLGFPTANIQLCAPHPIGEGIYAAKTKIRGLSYHAALFVGSPREANNKKTFEVHIFDLAEDLYGEFLLVEICEKTSYPQSYETFEELQLGIEREIKIIRNYFCI